MSKRPTRSRVCQRILYAKGGQVNRDESATPPAVPTEGRETCELCPICDGELWHDNEREETPVLTCHGECGSVWDRKVLDIARATQAKRDAEAVRLLADNIKRLEGLILKAHNPDGTWDFRDSIAINHEAKRIAARAPLQSGAEGGEDEN